MGSSFKLDFLPEAKIEAAAEELLAQYSKRCGRPVEPPIPVEGILEKHLHLTLEFNDLQKFFGKPGILGATWIKEQIVRIDESLEDGAGRCQFTIAHEIGHWQLHRPLMILAEEIPVLFEYSSDGPPPNIVCRRSQAREPMEWQADQFAACLLMPKKFMKRAFAALHPGGLQLPKELSRLDQKDTNRLAWMNDVAQAMIRDGGFSNCSREAMRIRIESLKLVDCSGMAKLL